MSASGHVSRVADGIERPNGIMLSADEKTLYVNNTGGEYLLAFDVQPFRKYCLLGGYDDIGLTLRHADKIRAFEAERLARHPWLESRPVA